MTPPRLRDGVKLPGWIADPKTDVESNWTDWLTFSLLTGFFVLGATANARTLYLAYVARAERVPSGVPVLPGLVGLVGLGVCPIPWVAEHAWLALILDLSIIATLLISVPRILRELWQTGRFNRVHLYESLNCDDGRVSIKLYRRGVGVVIKVFDRKGATEPGIAESSGVYQWTLAGASLVLSSEGIRVSFRQDEAGTLECVDRTGPVYPPGLFFPGLRLAQRQ